MIQKRKVLTLVACLMVVGLIASLIGGCAGGGGGGSGVEEETPRYGGVLVTWQAADPTCFDDAIEPHWAIAGPYQCLWGGDWAKGIAGGYGTKECDWYLSGELNRLEYRTGYIAESWEIGDDYVIFYLRDGVKFHDKYPCNGREVTADDVVFSLERQRTLSTGHLKMNHPDLAAAMSISTLDERTVRIDCLSHQYMAELLTLVELMYIYPQDVIETYGDMNDWERAIGTGAFTFEEYVEGTYLYYERNPDYWQTNPVGPGQGDQLPYLDGVKTLIESDAARQDSLFSTGQVAVMTADTADYDRVQALKALPGVKYVRLVNKGPQAVIFMRTDKADKPYHDVKVRQALMLAIDHQKIIDELYGGEGEILYWPLAYSKEYTGAYLPLEDYPASVQELFEYNPTKAKQLLADAGYPDGFQVEIVVYNHHNPMSSIAMVKDMWVDIGVDLIIKPLDYSTFINRQYTGSYNDMLYGYYAGAGTYLIGLEWSSVGVSGTAKMWNASYINDPLLNDYRDQMLAAYPDENECDRIHREMLPYLQEQCYVLQTAARYTYRFWWPWVKNYSGEGVVGFWAGVGSWTQYVWIDQELKEEMGHGD